ICLRPPFAFRQARPGAGRRSGEQVDGGRHEEGLEADLCVRLGCPREAAALLPRPPTTRDVLSVTTPRRTEMLRSLILAAALLPSVQAAMAQAPKTWTQVGMLTCKLSPSIGFVIFGHQSMECRFVQNPPSPVQLYEGALNTVGVDIGISAGGVLGWAVLAPTAGPPPGALAGEY